jgi:hypothetical protein
VWAGDELFQAQLTHGRRFPLVLFPEQNHFSAIGAFPRKKPEEGVEVLLQEAGPGQPAHGPSAFYAKHWGDSSKAKATN